MHDLISRQAAVELIERMKPYHQDADDIAEMIANLPSAQPECEDAVSRFEVLRLIDYSSHDLNDAVDNRYMQNEIKQLPSVTPKQPGWIPCSEQMPEDGRYLCDYGDCIDFGRVTNGEWYVDGVVAWMPLPRPWEGRQDGV